MAFFNSMPYNKGMDPNTHTPSAERTARRDEREAKITHMQALVDEALASGISTKTVDDIWREARTKLGHDLSA